MSKIILGDLTLISFDGENEEHQEFGKILTSDKSVTKYLKSIKKQLQDSQPSLSFRFETPYLVAFNEEFIGYLYCFTPLEHEAELQYAVDRFHRGNHYGSQILRETSAFLLHSFEEIERIKLIILKSNKYSHIAASRAGFHYDYNYSYYKEDKKGHIK